MPGQTAQTGAGQIPGLTLLAWAVFNQAGVLKKGFNVGSIVKGTNDYTVNFAAPLPSADYVVQVMGETAQSGAAKVTPTVGGSITANAFVLTFVNQGTGGATLPGNGCFWVGAYG